MSQVTAELNYLRISPRKVREVADLLKGLDVEIAQNQLRYITRKSAKPLLKLLNSAVANAQHNFGLDKKYLYIKNIIVNEGIKLKRYKPKGFGLTMPIQRKTSHIKIVLEELGEREKRKRDIILAERRKIEIEKFEEKKKKELKEEKKESEKKSLREEKRKISKKEFFGRIGKFGKKLFQRKSI